MIFPDTTYVLMVVPQSPHPHEVIRDRLMFPILLCFSPRTARYTRAQYRRSARQPFGSDSHDKHYTITLMGVEPILLNVIVGAVLIIRESLSPRLMCV